MQCPVQNLSLLKRAANGGWLFADSIDDAECIRCMCPLGEPRNDEHTSHLLVFYIVGKVPDEYNPEYARCMVRKFHNGAWSVDIGSYGKLSETPGCNWRGPLLVEPMVPA